LYNPLGDNSQLWVILAIIHFNKCFYCPENWPNVHIFLYKFPVKTYLKLRDCLTWRGVTKGSSTQLPNIDVETQ
jgi:hypothetical protein